MPYTLITDNKLADATVKPVAKLEENKVTRELIRSVGFHVWRGSQCLVQTDDDGNVRHIHAGRMSTQRRGAWGRYYNFVVAYTPPQYRRQGEARSALAYMLNLHKPDRLKSLAGSHLGALLHLGMGDQMWGATEKGELLVDTPVGEWTGPQEMPFHARSFIKHMPEGEERAQMIKKASPLTRDQVLAFLAERYGVAGEA